MRPRKVSVDMSDQEFIALARLAQREDRSKASTVRMLIRERAIKEGVFDFKLTAITEQKAK